MALTTTARQRITIPRMAQLLAVVAFVLVGFLLGSGLGVGPSTQAAPVNRAIEILLLSGALALVALWLVERSRRGTVQDARLRDATTGLYNHAYMNEVVPRLVARDDRAGHSQIALVMLRVDLYDRIGQRYGRAAADQVLGLVGRKIRSQTRESDIAARFDDQTIAVYLQCEEVEQAVAFGRRLSMLLATEQIDWRGDVIKVSVSMGIAQRCRSEPLEALCARTRLRLTQAMDQGTGQIAA